MTSSCVTYGSIDAYRGTPTAFWSSWMFYRVRARRSFITKEESKIEFECVCEDSSAAARASSSVFAILSFERKLKSGFS